MIDVGMSLKSAPMREFLETYDLTVEYHFDRLSEGQDDSYSVESQELSLELLFDAHQRCTSIFVKEPANEIAQGLVKYPHLQILEEIESYALANALTLHRGSSWLRCDGPTHCFHYEFENGKLRMITVMAAVAAP